MSQDLCWECKMCVACGVCARTVAECGAYHEYYQLEETQDVAGWVKQSNIITPPQSTI